MEMSWTIVSPLPRLHVLFPPGRLSNFAANPFQTTKIYFAQHAYPAPGLRHKRARPCKSRYFAMQRPAAIDFIAEPQEEAPGHANRGAA
jgi:hypothetical protein